MRTGTEIALLVLAVLFWLILSVASIVVPVVLIVWTLRWLGVLS